MTAVCPHCKGKVSLATVLREKDVKDGAIETLYACPHCKAVLGFTFMG
ncbi:MAG: hypothetical protein HYY25_08480 [Candidatus Wallbacteria bacterium]|nr:hypothetical protein [Candidatus Wallbacteria bacterium]